MPYNKTLMGPLHLLIPNALVAADFVPDLMRGLRLPNLDFLAAHAIEADSEPVAAMQKAELTSWQSWLLKDDPLANLADVWATGLHWPVPAGSAIWLAEPVFYQIGRDHLVLHDPAELDIGADEAHSLAQVARPLLAEAGWELDIVTPQRWLLLRRAPLDLSGAAMECAVGLNVEPWLPRDQGSGAALRWLRVSNEIQMSWHDHPVNQQREQQGKAPVNALWLSGNGAVGPGRAVNRLRDYQRIHSTLPLLRGYADSGAEEAARTGVDEDAGGQVLKTWEAFIGPTRRQDWSAWRNAVQSLDQGLASVVAELRSGRIPWLELILCGEHTLRVATVRRSDFWKFWRRGSAAELFADHA